MISMSHSALMIHFLFVTSFILFYFFLYRNLVDYLLYVWYLLLAVYQCNGLRDTAAERERERERAASFQQISSIFPFIS